ncbi:MAG: GNAT family N-acetyltransferase [Candidatus Acidiferrales bacterium]
MSAAPAHIRILQAVSERDIASARGLIEEYGASLGINLSFQHFDEELKSLPGAYAPPRGALLLAKAGEECAGCVALRPMTTGICEMKRLYVRSPWRSCGLGKRLVEAVLDEARRSKYRAIRLDTLPSMTAARAMYASFGFRPIPPYCENPIPGTAFLELDLTRPAFKS